MKIKIAGPSPLEASSVEVEDGKVLTVVPIPIKGQHSMKIAHLTAKGDSGREAKAVVIFNANTGKFSLQNHDTNVVFDFDKPVVDKQSKPAQPNPKPRTPAVEPVNNG